MTEHPVPLRLVDAQPLERLLDEMPHEHQRA